MTTSVIGFSGHVGCCTNECSKCLELNIFVCLGDYKSKHWFCTVLEAGHLSSGCQRALALGRAPYSASGLCLHAVEGAWQLCGAHVIHNQVISHCHVGQQDFNIQTWETGRGTGTLQLQHLLLANISL